MPYIYLNKETNEARIFGSLEKLSNETNLNVNTLYSKFSAKKLTDVETDQYRIVRTNIEQKKHK